mgnify:CR=1 FL=1
MKNSKMLKSILLISGLIAAGIGGALLFFPVAFQASSGIELGDNISLLSEVRAPGGALFASGILMVLGAFVSKLTFTSLVVSILIYLSYGLSRILGMAIDGMPGEALIMATVLEIIIGIVGVFALLKYRDQIA